MNAMRTMNVGSLSQAASGNVASPGAGQMGKPPGMQQLGMDLKPPGMDSAGMGAMASSAAMRGAAGMMGAAQGVAGASGAAAMSGAASQAGGASAGAAGGAQEAGAAQGGAGAQGGAQGAGGAAESGQSGMEWLTKAMDIFSQVLSTVQSAISDVSGMLQPLMSMAGSLSSMGKGQ